MSHSRELPLDRLGSVLGTGAKVAEAASNIAENAGRYVKLTKESAEQVKKFGLMPTKTKGISHAILGDPSTISKWIQIEDGPASLLMNPAILSGVAGVMAQLARQQEAQELKRLLVAVNGKLDDVRRRQRDEVLAKMDRVGFVIDEAMAIRDHGGDRETAWDKVKTEVGIIAEVQADAMRALEALGDKVDGQQSVGVVTRATQDIEKEVGVWLAVLAQCFQLQNEYQVLELDHVFDTAPASLDGHRIGLAAALRQRRSKIILRTGNLMTRLDQAGGVARENVVLHARAARKIVNSVNTVNDSIDDFHRPFAIESHREPLTITRWIDAVRDPQQLRKAAAEAGLAAKTGLKVAGGALGVGAVVVIGAALRNDDSEESSDEDA